MSRPILGLAHRKSSKVRDAFFRFTFLNPCASVPQARCDHAKAAAEVEAKIWKRSDFMHVSESYATVCSLVIFRQVHEHERLLKDCGFGRPRSLIVDPGCR